jgi:hypothetical protein
VNPKTGAKVAHDAGEALVFGQRPTNGGKKYTGSGPVFNGGGGSMNASHIPAAPK